MDVDETNPGVVDSIVFWRGRGAPFITESRAGGPTYWRVFLHDWESGRGARPTPLLMIAWACKFLGWAVVLSSLFT